MTAFPYTLEAYIAAYEKRVQVTILLPTLQQQEIQHLLAHMCHIFRARLASGYIRKSWRQVKVTFILLPGEVNYTEARAYCSLNLSYFTLKMIQKLEDRNIRDEILRFHPLQ
jgi:hypothetical protein